MGNAGKTGKFSIGQKRYKLQFRVYWTERFFFPFAQLLRCPVSACIIVLFFDTGSAWDFNLPFALILQTIFLFLTFAPVPVILPLTLPVSVPVLFVTLPVTLPVSVIQQPR